MKNTCLGCAYFATCGDKSRTIPCEGKKLSKAYMNYTNALLRAYEEDDTDSINALRKANMRYYHAVMKEIVEAYKQM